MFKNNDGYPGFTVPERSAKVWRYSDFKKFLWLLAQQALYFPSATVLLDCDLYEGCLGPVFYRQLGGIPDNPRNNDSTSAAFLTPAVLRFRPESSRIGLWREWQKSERRGLYINCWHLNEHESAAMWSQYLDADHGV